jgi:hypothetical protein
MGNKTEIREKVIGKWFNVGGDYYKVLNFDSEKAAATIYGLVEVDDGFYTGIVLNDMTDDEMKTVLNTNYDSIFLGLNDAQQKELNKRKNYLQEMANYAI